MKRIAKAIITIIKILGKTLGAIIALLLILYSIPYMESPVYDFPNTAPFHGDNLFNPYEDTTGEWLKTNFHAHAKAWRGITNGHQTEEELYEIYKNLGYDFVGVSNYQKIKQPENRIEDEASIPIYEHGYSVMKRHHLCIGAKKVIWSDLLFYQSLSHKQYMIDLIKPTVNILAIAHPEFHKSFEPADFTKLTNYDYVEVLNHYRISAAHWDSALSAGIRVWGMGDDDSHNQTKPDETGRFWTMIRANDNTREDIVAAMKIGNVYGVGGYNAYQELFLDSLTVQEQSIYVAFNTNADSIFFIGQNGMRKLTLSGTSGGQYTFSPKDTYIRIEATTDTNHIYLNPVYRFDDDPNFSYEAEINTPLTWLNKLIFILIYILIALFIYNQIRKKIVKRKNVAK